MQRKYLSPDEVKTLLKFLREQAKEPDPFFSTKQSTYVKLHAFVATMVYSGARSKEVRLLKLKDVNLGKKPSLFIGISKNSCSRHVPIPTKLRNILKGYVRWLRTNYSGTNDDSYLFTTKGTGKPYTYQALYNHFKLACIRSGIGSDHSSHGLRHSYGFRIYGATKDLRLTQELLGHKSISSTTIYTQLDPAAMRQTINAIF